MKKRMNNGRSVPASVLVIVLTLALCLSMTGCADLLESYGLNTTPAETLEEGESIYNLSMFESLPSDYSTIDPLFWEVEGSNGGKLYLLGTIHAADSSTYRLPEKIMNAYFESDSLAVECNTLAYQNNIVAQLNSAKDMMYTDGTTIADHIDPELYQLMKTYVSENMTPSIQAMGYTTETLDRCKPSVWMSVMDNMSVEAAGLDTNLGIDTHFLTIATAQSKDIIEVESVDFQMGMLAGFSDDVYDMLLSSYVSSTLAEQGAALSDIYKDWQVGNAENLLTYDVTPEDFEGQDATKEEIDEYISLYNEYNDAMLNNRNIGMADTAENMLNNGQKVFYIVGAAHMVGTTGIVALLRQRGFTVKQIGGKDAEYCTYVNSVYTAPESDAPTTTNTTAATDDVTTTYPARTSTTLAPYQGGNELYDDMYDTYEKLYEYFGGTTMGNNTTTATEYEDISGETTKRTTNRTTTRTSANGDGGWGGWGSSDRSFN